MYFPQSLWSKRIILGRFLPTLWMSFHCLIIVSFKKKKKKAYIYLLFIFCDSLLCLYRFVMKEIKTTNAYQTINNSLYRCHLIIHCIAVETLVHESPLSCRLTSLIGANHPSSYSILSHFHSSSLHPPHSFSPFPRCNEKIICLIHLEYVVRRHWALYHIISR